jgi:2-polyprenyl-3-methyl-5-hydroxy-6-metoxy-1,4-benzoquinol methylase
MQVHSFAHLRKERERAHGKFLASRALEIWGWSTPAGMERARRRIKLIIERAGIQQGMTVLEYGCGTGMFSRLLAESGIVLRAVDLSPDLIAEAQKDPDTNISFQVGDIESLAFPKESFDAVVGSSVLHHVNVEKALTEAFRVLKPGKRLAFAEPNMMNPQIALQKNVPYIKRKMGDSPDETAFFRWEARRFFRRAGFIDIVVQPFDFLHPAIPPGMISTVNYIGTLMEAIPVLKEIAGSLIISGRKP